MQKKNIKRLLLLILTALIATLLVGVSKAQANNDPCPPPGTNPDTCNPPDSPTGNPDRGPTPAKGDGSWARTGIEAGLTTSFTSHPVPVTAADWDPEDPNKALAADCEEVAERRIWHENVLDSFIGGGFPVWRWTKFESELIYKWCTRPSGPHTNHIWYRPVNLFAAFTMDETIMGIRPTYYCDVFNGLRSNGDVRDGDQKYVQSGPFKVDCIPGFTGNSGYISFPPATTPRFHWRDPYGYPKWSVIQTVTNGLMFPDHTHSMDGRVNPYN